MPVQYVGRTTSFNGKRLYDILCRLNNWGVGRMVYRNVFHERYPEKSYYVITKVEPEMVDPSLESIREDKKRYNSKAAGHYVFRGKHMGESRIDSGWKADWRLVPKDQEETFKALVEKAERQKTVSPGQARYPPLLEHMYTEQMKALGTPLKEPPMLDLKISTTKWNNTEVDRNAFAN